MSTKYKCNLCGLIMDTSNQYHSVARYIGPPGNHQANSLKLEFKATDGAGDIMDLCVPCQAKALRIALTWYGDDQVATIETIDNIRGYTV